MSLDPLGTTTAHFQRAALDKIGLDPKARDTLETLPLNQDALVAAIDETRVEINTVEAAPFVLFDADAGGKLENGRLLSDSDNIAPSHDATTVTLDLTDTGAVAGTYGAATKLVVLAIDAKGRVTAASEVALESGNVTETTKLFFTVDRARAAISAGAGIDYNPATGVISLAPSGVTPGTYTPPASETVDTYGRVTAIS